MESIGVRLKKLRLEKGLSLEETHKKTKIHLNILKAIEEDNFVGINPIYLKGFLKIYCKFLGVDPKDYVPDYRETQVVVKPVKHLMAKTKDVSGKPEKIKSFIKTTSTKLSLLKPNERVKRAIIFILVIIVFSLILFKLGRFISSRHLFGSRPKKQVTSLSGMAQKEAQKIRKQKAVIAIKPTAAKNPVIVKAATLKEPSNKNIKTDSISVNKEASSGIRLGIRARENCWISLKVDGHLVFQRVLEKGRFESWQAKEKIELSLGKAGAVELEVNGKIFSNLGRRDQALKNILITKNGLNIER